jgi:hypothetical protein
MEWVSKYFKSLEIPQTANEKKASQGINWNSPYMSMLSWAQKRFFRRSLEDAKDVRLSEYLAMKKEEVDEIHYQRRLMKINQEEYQNRRMKK